MDFTRNLLLGRTKYWFGLTLLLIPVGFVLFSIMDNKDFDSARREVLLRRIGHELLLQSGDSASRVLPVKKIAENEYQISFERELTFEPGALVNTTQRLLAQTALASDYVVSVLDCEKSSIVYGYAISKNKKDDIVPCLGRQQPRACYTIDIKFKPRGIDTTRNRLLLGSLPFLAFIGFLYFSLPKPRKTLPKGGCNELLALGTVLFDAKSRKLIVNGTTIDLTGTESRLLFIFALSPNETIERNRLQKEIWEDEGVIVGRSLDMFISKLRKKLACDPGLKITVVRGKGYKLEINT